MSTNILRFRAWLVTGIAMVIAGGIIAFWIRPQGPVLPIPVPADMSQFDPQVRMFLQNKIKAVQESPRNAKTRRALALSYAANGLWNESRVLFMQLVATEPKQPLAPLYAAVALDESGDVSKALEEYAAVTRAFPDLPQGWARYGEACLKSGQLTNAALAFEKLIFLAPNEWRGPAGLGEVLMRQNRPAEAVPHFQRALALAPDATRVHHQLGLAFQALGRTNEANMELALGQGGISRPMQDSWAIEATDYIRSTADLIELAHDSIARGDPGTAVRVLEKLVDFQSNNLGLMNQLAIAWNQAGVPDRGKLLSQEIINQDPRNVPALVTLSFSCALLNQPAEALRWADQAVALVTNIAQVHLARANALLRLERDRDALDSLERAALCDPQNADIQLEMGDVKWRNLEDKEAALAHYRKAREQSPVSPAVHARLAELCRELGLGGEAEQSEAFSQTRFVATAFFTDAPAWRALMTMVGMREMRCHSESRTQSLGSLPTD